MWQTDKSPSRTCLDILKKDVKVLQLELKISTKNIQSNTSPHLGFKQSGNHLELNSKRCNEFFFGIYGLFAALFCWTEVFKLQYMRNSSYSFEWRSKIKYKIQVLPIGMLYSVIYPVIRPVRRRWIVKYNSQKSSQQKPDYKRFFLVIDSSSSVKWVIINQLIDSALVGWNLPDVVIVALSNEIFTICRFGSTTGYIYRT